MDRNREGRRASIVGSNGFNRRRPRTNSHRDSPDEDGGVEFQESFRLRDRVKKDRDRDRERERERDRETERERERSSRSKRRRAERLMNNREDGGDDTSEESMDDDEVYEDEENITATSTTTIGGSVRPPPVSGFISNHHNHSLHSNNHHSQSQQHNISSNNNISNNHHLQHRKSFPPASSSSSKVFRVAPVWKSGDEMIGVSVPRKARSASIKRSHDWVSSSSNNNGGVAGGEQILRQASTSPARQGLVSTSAPSPAAPMSPSSSNVSIRKKLKLGNNNGQKLKPPKASSKSSSLNPEDVEIEIAEVLYGMRGQSQGPSSKKEDSREVNRSSIDGKSQVSSPMSNSTSANNPILPTTSSPLSVVAPKRKRPRQVSENPSSIARSSPSSMDQKPKSEISSPNLEKIPGSAAENGYDMGNLVNSQGVAAQPPEPILPEAVKVGSESKPVAEELRESRDSTTKEEVSSPEKKEYSVVRIEGNNPEDSTVTASVSSPGIKLNSMLSGVENPREPKFEIDLMAPPPQVRSSPERDAKIDLRTDQKPVLSSVDADMKPVMASEKVDEKVKSRKDDSTNVGVEDKKGKGTAEEDKVIEIKGRNIDLQLDLEKLERDGNAVTVNKLHHQLPTKATREEPQAEKSGQSTSSLPLPVSMASWPGELPQMGYMAPLQGIVSMDGNAVTPAPIQPLFSQPRPKRCATHCYIAQNIHYLQQLVKMNPFWTGSASLFGSKPCNLNVVPSPDLLGNMAVRGVNNAPDKRQGLANIPSHSGKEKSSQPASTPDAAHRKQPILLQQALPPVAPSNILGPAFIFPLNQQQAAVAVASSRPTTAKPPTTTGSVAPSNFSNSATASASVTAGGAATAMSFNYPNMPPNETPYLAILQNNAYPFPIPAMGGPTNYRGPPSQAMPLFNGSFYSSQMIHPSQIQLQQPPASRTHQMQAHQNASSSTSSQKHIQSQNSRPQSSSANGGSGSENLQNFQTQRSQPSQLPQQSQNHHINPPRARHLENELCGEDSPSTADSRGGRASMNIYGQNFSVPIQHPHGYALMTPPAALTGAASSGSGNNQSEKKQQQQQQQGLKTGVDSQPPQTFPMSFGLINGTTTGPVIDMAPMSQNHAIFQNFPEATRQNIQMMAAAAAGQKKNFRISEDGKSGGGDSSATDDERKGSAGKSEAHGQSIVFTRTDLADASGSSRTSRPATSNNLGAINIPNAIQAQLQQQQMMQLHKQQQLSATLVARNKAPSTTSGNIYSEHLNSSSSTAAKFPNALSGYPQNLVQNSNVGSPAQSPQWKSSVRTSTSQAPSSLASSTASSIKNLSQQQSRTQQTHTQISFGGNQKPSAASQVQPPPSSSNQAPSSPMMVASPTTSSISKGPSGSPRNTGASTSSKTGQASSLSTQSAKNLQAVPSQKSPSILGNPHAISSSNSGTKAQMQQQSQQQQLPKNMQQTQLFFSHPYSQAQSPHSTSVSSTASGNSGYYMQRRRPQQHQQPTQHPPGALATSSTAMLSLCQPVTLASTSTNDPAKAIAAATSNVKGGGLPAQGLIHAAQFAAQSSGNLLPGFSYVHTVPAAVAVKPAEQKQPAGNDNLHPWQPEKK
ncbi:Protein TIME FOR COFFEE [Forsythia ovata]|uniref:Protein TIME FOR COFFEE n=1 Tax=Forsythia ovata TaxID=205694 RepID=A0ABD1PJ60_9LAMI